jgi:uncharacterized membrane protein YcaP (DUF421 family)
MPDALRVFLSSAGIFVLILFLARLIGKRQTSQLTFFDFVNIVVIGVLAGATSLGMIRIIEGLIALTVWILFPMAIYWATIKFKGVRDVVQGKEIVLINRGKIMEDSLLKARLSPEDLLSQLRKKNVFNTADVEFAVMEPAGDVSVMLKKDSQPATAKTLGLSIGQESVPQTVMMDGVIMDEALTAMGLNRGWLHTELEKAGVAPENVFIAQVDSVGQLYLDLFDDEIQVPQPKTKELLYATLKQCEAALETYALSTLHQEAKKMYGQSAKELAAAARELEPLLKR